MIYERWRNMKFKYRNRQFWCRGYYVDTVGKNEIAIQKYIENQLKEDHMSEQLTLDKVDPFTGNRKYYLQLENRRCAFKQSQNVNLIGVR